LNNHTKKKHPELLEGVPQRGRGRPRKYPPKLNGDFESTKYEPFFTMPGRKPDDGEKIDINKAVEEVFDFIYKSDRSDKLFSHPKTYEDNPILNNLVKQAEISNKPNNQKYCDDVFYEYLNCFKDKTNHKYFTLMMKFVLLFRECFDVCKNKDKPEDEKKQFTNNCIPEGLPDQCNEFYGEFLEPYDFFGITEQDEKNEIIEIIQHFCIWLFKKEYTRSKLSLAS
jgi:hypothetical protein